uniref:RBR-type E3 ubiquitin transferase n=1 Tax=Alexandrium monilatum TaxID=311494 RepID=A0A7S4WBP3_9DINO|mmetsp:Transcript_97048/g.302604  ORF Transcript_97048/g.302604 Transcript_97048/m.302604 type:complete len:495 (+) Transcript_97048:65-1549(+)
MERTTDLGQRSAVTLPLLSEGEPEPLAYGSPETSEATLGSTGDSLSVPMAAPLRHCPPLPLGASRGAVGRERRTLSTGGIAAAASAMVRRATSAASRAGRRPGSRGPGGHHLQLELDFGPSVHGAPTMRPPMPQPETPVPSPPPSPQPLRELSPPPPPPPPLVPARCCPICIEPLELAAGETFCGVHLYCADCAARCAREELQQGLVPRCPDCHKEIEPVAAQRILRFDELERYFHLALWSNDSVAVCPKCRQGLYTDEGHDLSSGRCQSAHCPTCGHEFCVECRGPAHPDVVSCEEAARLQLRRGQRRRGAVLTTAEGVRAAPATPFACRVAVQNQSYQSSSAACGSSSLPDPQDSSGFFVALGVKGCPRCGTGVQKLDDESCDHMTCANCRHEFCWTCLADRRVIYAHGNHYHRPGCKFFSPYDGPDAVEYLPERCKRCAKRKTACRPLSSARTDSTALVPAGQFGALDQWFWAVMEIFTLRSCQGPQEPPR